MRGDVPAVVGFPSAGRSNGEFAPDTLLGSLSATPSSVSFGSVAMGLVNSQTISLTNTGSASVKVNRASISGAGFGLSGLSPSTTIAPGASITFNVSFRPSSATAFAGTATILSNGSDSSLPISLSGTGTAASSLLGASPASLAFGNVTVGATSTLSVSLTNSGNMNITINKVTSTSTAFTTSGVSGGLILGPSQTATLNVAFTPASATNASASITISSNASGAPVKIPLSGLGVQASAQSVSLNWSASTSSGIIGYDVYRGTVSGGPYNLLTSSPDASTEYTDSSVLAGNTYYYVVTSVNSSNVQSSYSSQVAAAIPAQ